ncbi:MAG: SPOR domain-containing protein, partial [Desulfitobacteriaceae bacterium]|nr:SPOR domain-containing protein [Desulfitobacteriaceae bacterium]
YEGYQRGIASNHADPKNWFSLHGKSIDTFRTDVKKALIISTSPPLPSPPLSTEPKNLYRVQVGAYSVRANADAMLEKVKAAGFKDAFIKTE